MRLRLGLIVIALVLAGAAAFFYSRLQGPASVPPRHPNGPFTIVLTGDTMLARTERLDMTALQPVMSIVQDSNIAFTNLEATLTQQPLTQTLSGWPYGGPPEIQALQKIGFNAVSCANNHALDYGVSGAAGTMDMLKKQGLSYSGCGGDLGSARAPAIVTGGGMRVGLVSITASALPETRATARRGEIAGKGGVNTLRFDVRVTLDPDSFRIMAGTSFAKPVNGGKALQMLGTTIVPGDKIEAQFVANQNDIGELLNTIRSARKQSDILIVSLHGHTPDNASPAPAKFLESFARDAVDAGAQIVVGHGPHRLRGVEKYHQGLIFYSLGDFLYQRKSVPEGAYDAFDRGTDPQSPNLGMPTGARPAERNALEYRQSAMAVITFDHAAPQSAKLVPLSLAGGVNAPDVEPQIAKGSQAAAILDAIRELSRGYGTTLSADGVVQSLSAN